MSELYVSKAKGKKRVVEIIGDDDGVLLLRNIKSKTVSRRLKSDFRNCFKPLIVPFGPEPVVYETSVSKIYAQRSGCCPGCRWHPDVCQHCMRRLDTDG